MTSVLSLESEMEGRLSVQSGWLLIWMLNSSIGVCRAKDSDEYIRRGVIGYGIEVLSCISAEEDCDWWE
jgi:hypothetical protein